MTFQPDDRQQRLLGLAAAQHNGVLVTLKRDGRPQLSNITYGYEPATQLVRISVTADRAKTRNLARDPRASLYLSSADFWSWAVLEGTAELSAIAADPHDAAVDELVDVYRSIAGAHPDWEEYRAAMVADHRQVVRIWVEHVYGQLPG